MCIRDSVGSEREKDTTLEWVRLKLPTNISKSSQWEYDPVSYTHLDVYKRQHQTSV